MSEKANKVRIGAFVIGALALTLLAVGVIGSGSLFSAPLRVVMFFESSLKGLSAGSPIVFRGVPIGRVAAIRMSGDVNTMEFLIPVYAELDASVIQTLSSSPSGQPFLHKMVQQGLCARLSSQSLLTGQLLIEMDFFPGSRRHEAFMPMLMHDSLQVIPTIPSQFDTFWQRLSTLPVERLVQDTLGVLAKIDATLGSQAVTDMPAHLDAVLIEARSALVSMNTTLASFNELAVSLRSATGMLDKQAPEALESVRRLMDAYSALAGQLERNLESVRGLMGPNTATVLEFTRTVREIGEAAKAVRSLAGALERNPESLLLGKRK
jgi:paraquat-inducible protein B